VSATFKYLIAGGLFLLNVALGIVLNRSGKPYNVAVISFHKLSALAFTVLAALWAINAARNMDVGIALLIAMISAGVLILGLFATGALVSTLKTPPGFLVVLHTVLTVLAAAASAVSFIFTVGRSL
jgi:hypothetical protein